jgi:UDP-N-acetyl-2-amino-2-deoxyglucuronate dehydrogenase
MAKIYRLAIIGCGKVADKYIKAVRHHSSLIELVALSDTRVEAMHALLRTSKLPFSQRKTVAMYEDYRIMLKEILIDIVAVTTPSGTHAKIGLDVLKSHRNLIVEKPMALSLSDCDLLNQTAKEQGLKIALGHIYRFFPIVRMLSEDISRGVFGDILHGSVKVYWGHDQAYYNQASWRGTWEQDGGVLMNQSIHALDLMLYLMKGRVTEVCSMIAQQTHSMESEDLAMGILRFDNGSYCCVEGTTNTSPSDPQASFFLLMTKGSIAAGIRSGKPYFEIRGIHNKKLSAKYFRRFLSDTLRNQGIRSFRTFSNPHSGIIRDMCLSISEDRQPLADGLSGRSAVETVLAMYSSAKSGCSRTLPLNEFSCTDMKGFFDS